MAYIIGNQDWVVCGLCSRADSNGDLDLREEFLIVVLLFREWLAFVGILGFLTFQIILQNSWKNEEDQKVDDFAMLQKPPYINGEQQQEEEVDEHEYEYELNEYGEDNGFEFSSSEDLDYDEFDILKYLNKEDSGEEEEKKEEDAGTARVYFTVDRRLNEEVKYKLSYFFRDLCILESQSVVTDEPTAFECENADEAFEGNADEEQWGKDENGDLEGRSYKDQNYKDSDSAKCYFLKECSCIA